MSRTTNQDLNSHFAINTNFDEPANRNPILLKFEMNNNLTHKTIIKIKTVFNFECNKKET